MSSIVEGLKYLGSGTATVGLTGAGVGIGVVFGLFVLALAQNPSLNAVLFKYTILGFALTEATALFSLMMAFLILFL